MSTTRTTPPIDLPVFVSVEVNITPSTSSPGNYTVTYDGSPTLAIDVASRNTVLRFGLDAATPDNVYFVGMTTSLYRSDPQLSSYSISVDRRVLLCSDFDTVSGPIDVTLKWIIGTPFSHDPQVHNKPGGAS